LGALLGVILTYKQTFEIQPFGCPYPPVSVAIPSFFCIPSFGFHSYLEPFGAFLFVVPEYHTTIIFSEVASYLRNAGLEFVCVT
jgi:hypothetical protein